jgi:RNA polymerase sigma-32 factor
MVAENPNTLQEIGELFGVSRERARQLEARIMRRLSKYLDDRVDASTMNEFQIHG